MAQFISASATFRQKLTQLLNELFKGKVDISESGYTLSVKVGRDAGVKTTEDAKGIWLGLDGRTFLIEVREIKEPKNEE